MNVIWKRPDGYHDAAPSDYYTYELGNKYCIWLHKKDKLEYPLRISGGWEDQISTEKLNRFVNLLPSPDEDWISVLKKELDDSMDDKDQFFDKLFSWIEELNHHLKGEHWELLVLEQILKAVFKRLEKIKAKI